MVRAGKSGQRRTLFSGRTTYPLILTDGVVNVGHGRRYPYAALLPAAGGPVEIDAMPGSRAEFGSSMRVRAAGPERGDAYDFFDERMTDKEYRWRTEYNQRGPMIDVLGPTVHFSIPATDDLKVFAAYRRIEGIRPDEPVSIKLRTPFALRLIPHPAKKRWTHSVSHGWDRMLGEARQGDPDVKDAIRFGPTLQGRFIETNPQTPYSLHVENIRVPPPAVWRRFARTSRRDGMVSAMLEPIGGGSSTIYQLPPVSDRVQVGVFGPLEKLESTVLRGQVLSEGESKPFGRGQEVSVSSDEGLATGRYQMTPLVSAGLPTDQANVAGEANVFIDSEPVNRPPVVALFWGTVIVVVLGLLIEVFVKWGLGESRDK
jgi:hypothetical protein